MTSAKTFSPSSDVTAVFLDANILAKPVTRTLLMVGGVPSGYQAVWSLAAEREAIIHMRPRALSPALVRQRFEVLLGPTGEGSERFGGTKGADRQILADAEAAGARFMLRSLKAPESYFQAAFRVQSPWKIDGVIQKETAYVFEFDPNRALSLVALYGTELANNSPDRKATQRSVLGELINFLPIFAIDGGQMEELTVDAILDWAHGGISANSLARRWKSVDLYNINGVTMDKLIRDEDLLAELEQIEDFRTIREEAEKIVTRSQQLGDVKRKGGAAKEQRPHKKEIAEKRKNIREKLKKVSAKVLIFMYLTDFREERLAHVIESFDTDLFLRSTGLSLPSDRKLTEIGVINVGNMTDAIQKFRYFEKKSIEALVGGDAER